MEIELTPFLQNLLLSDIEAKNKITQKLDHDLKIIFEAKGHKMQEKQFSFEVKEGKLIYEEIT
jgi:hypothetical protein